RARVAALAAVRVLRSRRVGGLARLRRARADQRARHPGADRAAPSRREILMAGFLLRRVLYGVLILIGVNLLTFILFFTISTPDDMARLNIGGKYITQSQIDTWKVAHGYDNPL